MKALNVAVRETPVGLVAVLPPGWSAFAGIGARQDHAPFNDIDPGDVLGVVTKAHARQWADACEWCKAYEYAERCTCSYAPLRFVKVLAVWPITDDAESVGSAYNGPACIEVNPSTNYCRWWPEWDGALDYDDGIDVDLPDAEPGGVALHVEWTDCRCDGRRIVPNRMTGTPDPCPTCQTPPTVEGDGPIVEVE